MGNLLRDPIKKNNQPYNGFPMHQWNYFSCSVGQAIPFFYDFLQPGDKISFSTDMFNRMTTLLSSSPVGITNHVQYFFVPLRYLYSIAPSLLTAVDDVKTTFVDKQLLQSTIPNIDLAVWLSNLVSGSESNVAVNEPYTYNQTPDLHGDNLYKNMRRVLQGLGYGDFFRDTDQFENDWLDSKRHISVSPLLACAYQLIYQDYFRIDEREDLDPVSFNLDAYYSSPDITSRPTYINQISKMFHMWYVPWKKDYFTNTDVSPLTSSGSHSIFSAENEASFEFIKQWLISGGDQELVDSSGDAGVINSATNVLFSPNSDSGTQGHRLASVLERFASIVGSSDKNYRDQIQALYGFTPPKFTSNMCERIGYDSLKLNIYEVTSDATTGLPTDDGASQLGDIAGKSVSYKGGKNHKYVAPEHGFFIAIAFSVPDAIYAARGLDKINTYLERTDFPNPLFDRLGQEPLFMEQVRFVLDTDVTTRSLGWIYRHQELKQKYDRCFGAFMGSLKYWIPTRDDVAFQQSNNIALYPYYVNPWYLNSILLVPYAYQRGGAPISTVKYYWSERSASDDPQEDVEQRYLFGDHLFDTDPLMNFYKVNYVKSSKMDVYGIPKNMM